MKHLRILCASSILATALALTSFASSSKSNVGQTIPEIKADYVKGKPETAGKPMIVEFWATWCGPCKTSIPHLNEIYKKHKDKGLVVIGLTDESNQVIRNFTKQVPIEYFAATDRNGKLNKHFGVQGIPHALLVDKTGKVVWEGHPAGLKDADISKILE
jgi:cytochrome c biogenesis protein CcmG, thiol:disulfide interchange protein DsbE